MSNTSTASLSEVTSRARWRYAKDRAATVGVSLGGVGVIGAVVLIFFYLLWVVLPLFFPAKIEAVGQLQSPSGTAETLFLAMEEQAEMGLRVGADGGIVFFSLEDGSQTLRQQFPSALSAVTTVDAAKGQLAALGRNGQLYRFRHAYRLEYPQGAERVIKPRIEFPLGEEGLSVGEGTALAVGENDDRLLVAVSGAEASQLRLLNYEKSSSFLDDSISLDLASDLQLPLTGQADQLIIDPLLDWLYVIDRAHGQVVVYNLRRPSQPELVETVKATRAGERITAATLLAGGISLLTASSDGSLTQWFPLRDEQGRSYLREVRGFQAPAGQAVTLLTPEYARRGFFTLSNTGQLGAFHATAERKVIEERIAPADYVKVAVAPRADRLLIENEAGELQLFAVHNEHPEVSWSSLWGKVWYESYQEPEYVWQSSAANSDFEPKFSLAPLSFGTLKAAFYAMLFAVPLALAGAVFTAYFMAPGLRQMVKPTIEVMEALPTVILGFLAGLWLAPFVESFLPGVFVMIVFLIITMPLTGYLWSISPERIRHKVSDGWQPVLLMLPLILAGAAALLLSRPIEIAFFDGSLPNWLANQAGITYDQRNSLVVGLAMGFAVIPTIFSIAEDAVFGVPKSLSQGSLALGATPWQTLTRVILPTASPGIFSALMIGLGRAVGETMIVLMATGNTPIMDFNIFEGFRTLSANIAVEMPESEVGSTHFRILFLAGLVLFLFTFVFNTLAEVVRQRLRSKYSNL